MNTGEWSEPDHWLESSAALDSSLSKTLGLSAEGSTKDARITRWRKKSPMQFPPRSLVFSKTEDLGEYRGPWRRPRTLKKTRDLVPNVLLSIRSRWSLGLSLALPIHVCHGKIPFVRVFHEPRSVVCSRGEALPPRFARNRIPLVKLAQNRPLFLSVIIHVYMYKHPPLKRGCL